jgi:hypothetical protein
MNGLMHVNCVGQKLARLWQTKEMKMRFVPTLMASVVFSTTALAQTAASDADHAAHHPPAASEPAAASKVVPKPADKPSVKASAPSSAQMGSTMKSMQEMHDKMMAAKTPEERQALMADHMKAMQGGMGMMGQMKSEQGGMSAGPEMMAKRMDMMEMMMQMMMDREVVRSAPMK